LKELRFGVPWFGKFYETMGKFDEVFRQGKRRFAKIYQFLVLAYKTEAENYRSEAHSYEVGTKIYGTEATG
jgi:hypothetical protein